MKVPSFGGAGILVRLPRRKFPRQRPQRIIHHRIPRQQHPPLQHLAARRRSVFSSSISHKIPNITPVAAKHSPANSPHDPDDPHDADDAAGDAPALSASSSPPHSP